jgi:ribosomal protein S18 acetylase RimI-like enzyme
MEYRTATLQDFPQVKVLYELLFDEMAALQPLYYQSAAATDYLKETMENENKDIWVAIDKQIITGFISVSQEHTPPYGSVRQHAFAHVTELCVRPEYRKQGIGAALLDCAKSWAQERELHHIELGVLAENDTAIGVYEKAGYTTSHRKMRLKL